MKLIIGRRTFEIQKESLPEAWPFADVSWQKEISLFLTQWFDDKDYIELKTSGSTGEPKTIRLPKETMYSSAAMTNSFFQLNKESVAMLCLPASYIAGKMMLVRAIAGDYTLIAVEPSANPFASAAFPALDFTAITPYQLLHSSEDIPRTKIRNIIVGGSQVNHTVERLIANWSTRLYETFGMTETASHIALRPLNGKDKSAYFQTLEGIDLSLDKRGCLVIDAPHLSAVKLITNDLVELKDQHSFRWLGRIDRVINSGGVKIFPEQVERKLQSLITLPYFITALPSETLGWQVVLVVESNELTETELLSLRAAMKSLLDPYEQPGRIICLPKFVYSAGNKLLRKDTMDLLNNSY